MFPVLLLLTVLAACKSIQDEGGADWATVKFSLDHPQRSIKYQAASSGDIGTALIIAVPESITSINTTNYISDYFSRGLLDLTNSSIELSLPLNVPLRIAELTFAADLSLDQIVTDQPTAYAAGISELITIAGTDGIITVSIPLNTPLSSTATITEFKFLTSNNSVLSSDIEGNIDETDKTIIATVPYGTDISTLIATFTSTGQTVKVEDTVQTSGNTTNDFRNTVTYTVTVADGMTQDYVVTVTIVPSDAKQITSFQFLMAKNSQFSSDVTGGIDQNNRTIGLGMHFRSDPTALVADFTTTGSKVEINDVEQISGSTTNDFTNPATYKVIAADETSQTYTVTANLNLEPITDTGQTTSHTATFGEDGDYIASHQQSFMDNGDGTVTDKVTKLVWQQCSYGQSGPSCGTGTTTYDTHASATTYCNNNTPGLPGTGWRLPGMQELVRILKNEGTSPLINATVFPATGGFSYWSGTDFAADTTKAWIVYFNTGVIGNAAKTGSQLTRCVKGTISTGPSFNDQGDQTVTDSTSGLTWDQRETATMNWEAALGYCESLNHAGKVDWRLPNRNELHSLLDELDSTGPIINATYFPSAISLAYWTATTNPVTPANAYYTHFNVGSGDDLAKTTAYNVRCVR